MVNGGFNLFPSDHAPNFKYSPTLSLLSSSPAPSPSSSPSPSPLPQPSKACQSSKSAFDVKEGLIETLVPLSRTQSKSVANIMLSHTLGLLLSLLLSLSLSPPSFLGGGGEGLVGLDLDLPFGFFDCVCQLRPKPDLRSFFRSFSLCCNSLKIC